MKVSMARIDQAGWRDPVNIVRFCALSDVPPDEFQRPQPRKLSTAEKEERSAPLWAPRPSGRFPA
jgi:hypothetical protein